MPILSSASPVIKGFASLISEPGISNLIKADQMHWKIGNRLKILFREDSWNPFGSLHSKYPRLYRISKWKFKSIQEVISLWLNQISMEPSWLRPLREWEVVLAKEIEDLLRNLQL